MIIKVLHLFFWRGLTGRSRPNHVKRTRKHLQTLSSYSILYPALARASLKVFLAILGHILGSPRTFFWFFLPSSSLLFVFSEQLRFEHQLRSRLLSSKMIFRSINGHQNQDNQLPASPKHDQPRSNTQDNRLNNSRPLKEQVFWSLTVMTLNTCFSSSLGSWKFNTFKVVRDRSKRQPIHVKIPARTNCTRAQLHSKLEKESRI